jgi:hypothetical protein
MSFRLTHVFRDRFCERISPLTTDALPHLKATQQLSLELILITRLDTAIENGVINLVPTRADVGRAIGPSIDLDTLGVIFEVLFPKQYGEPSVEPTPTLTPPKSEERQRVYAKRRKLGQKLYHTDDADVCDHAGLSGRKRANCDDIIVDDWLEE